MPTVIRKAGGAEQKSDDNPFANFGDDLFEETEFDERREKIRNGAVFNIKGNEATLCVDDSDGHKTSGKEVCGDLGVQFARRILGI